jgi:threonine aldolase
MIDLSSDTATRPTPEMRAAIAAAAVGDEQRGEDPTVNALQERVAALFGKEDALFLPSGTMCNHIAIKVHTQPADAIMAHRDAHIIRAEAGAPAFHSGVLMHALDGASGRFTVEQIMQLFTPGSNYEAATRVLCLEQTHNFGGGAIWPLAQLEAVCGAAHERGMLTHLDGARIMNAVVETGIAPHVWAAPFDSLWVDFSKGLGAPVGAALTGSRAFVGRARRYKHLFGGAMRQAGIIAAGALYALDHHVDRLAEDHVNARRLADGLRALPGVTIENVVETNIVFFTLDPERAGMTNGEFLERLGAHGVRLGAVRSQIRAVTHLDVSRDDTERAIEAARAVLAEAGSPPVRSAREVTVARVY